MRTTAAAPPTADLQVVRDGELTAAGARPLRALLVASSGGHLLEMTAWAKRFVGVGSTTWVTSQDLQSRVLLAEEDVRWVRPVGPRGLRAAMSLFPVAHEILRDTGADIVVSTGSAVAFPFLTAARMRGVDACYIESATRLDHPSLTARLLRGVPGVRCYTQSPDWADKHWSYAGNIFDGFACDEIGEPAGPLRVVVALGSMHFPMNGLVDAVTAALPADASVTWQVGFTPAPDPRPGSRVMQFMGHDELAAAMRRADVVVSHAGVGTALTAMMAGRSPILVPRLAVNGEHVDDHQQQIAQFLASRGLASTCDSRGLTSELLMRAASRSVRRSSTLDGLSLLPPARG